MMRTYVNYDYYVREYKGNVCDRKTFEKLAIWATSIVRQMTFNRVDYMNKVPDPVSDAVCSLVDLKSKRLEQNYDLKSESNDGYSVTYKDLESDTDFMINCKREVRTYLRGTGLLNRCVCNDK